MDGPAGHHVRGDGAEVTGKPLRDGTDGSDPAGSAVVYDGRGPEPAGGRGRTTTGWRAAHSPLAGVALQPTSEPSESAGD